jgi:hypothetical protein
LVLLLGVKREFEGRKPLKKESSPSPNRFGSEDNGMSLFGEGDKGGEVNTSRSGKWYNNARRRLRWMMF